MPKTVTLEVLVRHPIREPEVAPRKFSVGSLDTQQVMEQAARKLLNDEDANDVVAIRFPGEEGWHYLNPLRYLERPPADDFDDGAPEEDDDAPADEIDLLPGSVLKAMEEAGAPAVVQTRNQVWLPFFVGKDGCIRIEEVEAGDPEE